MHVLLRTVVFCAILLAACTPLPSPSPTPEPLVPTVVPRGTGSPHPEPSATAVVATRLALLASPTPTPTLTATADTMTLAAAASLAETPSATPIAQTTAVAPTAAQPAATTAVPSPVPITPMAPITGGMSSWGLPTTLRGRIGVGLPLFGIGSFAWGDAAPGWYLNWNTQPGPDPRADIVFAPMIRFRGDTFWPSRDEIKVLAARRPGMLWLLGNEPDVRWQDNTTPEQYASSYGVLYQAIKEADPTARIAIGGISQPTPLRLAYLERVLAAYRARYGVEMPVDVWNVHAFILREEHNSWGVDIPPGMTEDKGTLYEIGDHADLRILRGLIEGFRRWMAERGQRDKPLIVTEYGILMPEDYGFPPELVSQFMTATFDYFLSARDIALGYAADDYRLVQAFCWYSAADTVYPTSNLFNARTREVTPVGEAFKRYVAALK